jgi:soluble lytic murein transglycosylase-like protein
MEDGRLVLELRNGGEIVCEASSVTGFLPDEVPYPDPPTPAVPSATESTPDRMRADEHAYDRIIKRVAAKHGVDARLVHAMIEVESAYDERARSPKGAMGLMQLMPETARQYAVGDPYDPAANIEGGTKHLKDLLSRFPTNLALAAYNAGEAAVERFRGIPPYPETRAYVRRVLELFYR